MPKKEFNGGSDDFAFTRTLDGHRALKTDTPYSKMSPEELAADVNDRRSLATPEYSGNDHSHRKGY